MGCRVGWFVSPQHVVVPRKVRLRMDPMATGGQFMAITLHRIPRKEVCGVVILTQQEDASWAGKCSKCGGDFRLPKDPKFDAQVRAMRN